MTAVIRRIDRLHIWIGATIVVLGSGALVPGLLATSDPFTLEASNRLTGPSTSHLFGTDEGGRDIFSRVIHGTRPSLGTALAIVVVAVLVGTIYGSVSGWVGGRVDRIMMQIVDVFLSFPYLVLAMAVAAALERGVRAAIIALAAVWWPSYARMVRGLVLSLKNDLHVKVASTLGASGRQLVSWHVLPYLRAPLATRATLDIGYALIALTGISFLGLGAQNPSPEWGLMVSNAKPHAVDAWWYGVFPGVVITLVVMNFVLLGDRLGGTTDEQR